MYHIELDDTFAWQTTRKLSKSLTFQYDKMLYLIEDTEKNSCLVVDQTQVVDNKRLGKVLQFA